jgi:hypothetical protein
MTNLLGDAMHISPLLWIYIVAISGSVAIELLTFFGELAQHNYSLPERYKNWSYCMIRIAFAFFASGPLAVMLDAQTTVGAFFVGVTAPLMFDRIAAQTLSSEAKRR